MPSPEWRQLYILPMCFFKESPKVFSLRQTPLTLQICWTVQLKLVKRMVRISFPHVEGNTSPIHPATGRLNGILVSIHADTRLENEKLLMAQSGMKKVILRCGMIYGCGILMIDAAHWFSCYYLLGIWRKPNFIHLISTDDFLEATKAAIYNPEANSIYHVGDAGIQTLTEFLDEATQYWYTCRPWRMPMWMIRTAAWIFECVS